MDGQQRSNAISMAFAFDSLCLLTLRKLEETQSVIKQGVSGIDDIAMKPILWIDVGADTGKCCDQTLRFYRPDFRRFNQQVVFAIAIGHNIWYHTHHEKNNQVGIASVPAGCFGRADLCIHQFLV